MLYMTIGTCITHCHSYLPIRALISFLVGFSYLFGTCYDDMNDIYELQSKRLRRLETGGFFVYDQAHLLVYTRSSVTYLKRSILMLFIYTQSKYLYNAIIIIITILFSLCQTLLDIFASWSPGLRPWALSATTVCGSLRPTTTPPKTIVDCSIAE